MHKLNRFHWHLTDDQGWRIEIDSYPLLTEISSRRRETQIEGIGPEKKHKYDGIPHEGFYTKDDIREIVAYAKERYIEVIPEIDIPGHFVAALAAYPEFSCTGGPFEVRTSFGIGKDVLCIGKPRAIEFVKNILEEIVDLFPYKHIHIGGDETPTTRWKKCTDCQALMKKHGFKKERELQTYFTDIIAEHLRSLGCKIICWDEVLKGKPADDIIAQYWSFNAQKRVKESIEQGRKVIISPILTYYLDYSFSLIPLKKTYEADPVFFECDQKTAEQFLGLEAPLWTEFVDSMERIHWQMFPQLTAACESAWTNQENKDYKGFLSSLKQMEKRYDAIKIAHAPEEAYTRRARNSVLSFFISLLLKKTHPAIAEYRKYHKEGEASNCKSKASFKDTSTKPTYG